MNRSILGALLVGLALSAGCTSWNGQREGEWQAKNVILEGNNFKILKSKLQASASTSYLFPTSGIAMPIAGGYLIPPGGIALGDPNLYEQAYKKLRDQAAIVGKSAQLHNVTEEITLTDYLVIGDLKLTLTCDVIEFTDEYKDYASRGK